MSTYRCNLHQHPSSVRRPILMWIVIGSSEFPEDFLVFFFLLVKGNYFFGVFLSEPFPFYRLPGLALSPCDRACGYLDPALPGRRVKKVGSSMAYPFHHM